MGAVKQLADKKVLKNLVPLNALTPHNLEKIARKVVVEEIRKGRFLFKQGDRDNHSVYILQGTVTLLADNREIEEINAQSDAALHPLSHFQPRQVSARASTNVIVVRIDTNLLDVMLTWDQSNGYEVNELETDDEGDWMTKLLQSKALQNLPPSNIQKLLMRMHEMHVGSGETIIQQGDVGEDYYIIKKGRCKVTRKTSQGTDIQLAELRDGDSFGEEALLANDTRNASVTMTSDGVLMRLAKQDFLELLKTPLVNQVNYQQAALMGIHGAVWLDVRLPEEFQHANINGSINIPLAEIRKKVNTLDHGKQYIVYCDTGRRSASAAFILSQKGFDVQVLNNGMSHVPEDELSSAKEAGKTTADIIDFNRENVRKPDISAESSVAEDVDRLNAVISQLNDELEQSNTKAATIELQLKKQTEQNKQIQSELQQMEKDADAAQSMFEKRLGQANREIQTHKGKLSERESQIENLNQRLNELQTQLQGNGAGQSDSPELQQAIGKLQGELQQALEHNNTLNAIKEKLEAKYNDAEKELAELRNRSAEQNTGDDTRLTEQRNLTRELRSKLDKADGRIEELIEQYDRLQTSKDEVQQELDVALGRIKTLEQSGDDQQALDEKIQSLEAELARRDEQIASQQTQQQNSTAQLSRLEDDIKSLTAERDQLSSKLNKSEGQHIDEINELTAKLADVREKFHNAQLARQQSKETESGLKTRVKSLESELIEARNATDKYKTEFKLINDELAKAREQLRDVHSVEQKFQSEMDMLRQDNQKLEKDHQRIKTELDELHEKLLEALREKAELEVGKDSAEGELKKIRDEQQQALKDARDETVRLEYEAARLRAELELANKKLERMEPAGETKEADHEEIAKLNEEIVCLRAELDTAKENAAEQSKLFKQQLAEQDAKSREMLKLQLDESRKRQKEESHIHSDRLKTELEQNQQTLKDAKREIKQWQTKVADMEARQTSAQEEIDDLKSELEVWKNLSEKQQSAKRDWDNAEDKNELDDIFKDESTPEINTTVSQLEGGGDDDWMAFNDDTDDVDDIDIDDDIDMDLLDDKPAKPPSAKPTPAQTSSQPLKPASPYGSGQSQSRPAAFQSSQSTSRQTSGFSSSRDSSIQLRLQGQEDKSKRLIARNRLKKRLVKTAVWLTVAAVLVGIPTGAYLFLGAEGIKAYYQSFFTGKTPHAGTDADASTANEAVKNKAKNSAKTSGKPAASKKPRSTTSQRQRSSSRNQKAQKPQTPAPAPAKPKRTEQRPTASAAARNNIVAKQTLKQTPSAFKPEMAVIADSPRLIYQDKMRNGGKGPLLIEIPGGRYVIGNTSPNAPRDERPAHQVKVKAFSISRYEVTFAEYDRFAEATNRLRPRDRGWGRAQRPVINVSWYDAKAYAQWLSKQTQRHYRLPSEAEWELAAAAAVSGKAKYWWGNDIGANNANCFNCASQWDGSQTAPVASFAPNGFGLYDTAGNVLEWVEDCYHPNYQSAPTHGGIWSGGDCSRNVARGGAYSSTADDLRTTKRVYYSPSTKLDTLGFRLVREH